MRKYIKISSYKTAYYISKVFNMTYNKNSKIETKKVISILTSENLSDEIRVLAAVELTDSITTENLVKVATDKKVPSVRNIFKEAIYQSRNIVISKVKEEEEMFKRLFNRQIKVEKLINEI